MFTQLKINGVDLGLLVQVNQGRLRLVQDPRVLSRALLQRKLPLMTKEIVGRLQLH